MDRAICFIGLDGSGKSTLIKNLRSSLNKNGQSSRYFHAYHEPFLLIPLKFLARKVFLGKEDQNKDYSIYHKRKSNASKRHPYLSDIYKWFWVTDYFAQTFIKVFIPILFSKKEYLILDRYIYDTVINIAVSLGDPLEHLLVVLDRFFRIFPEPDIVFLLDIPEEVAFARKTDIPSLEYLKERRHLYLDLAKRKRFSIVNANKSPDELLIEILNQIQIP